MALSGVLGGLLMEGGKLRDVSQLTAALIVLGGTTGAVMVSMPVRTLIGGLKKLKGVFVDTRVEFNGMIEEIIGFATKARKTAWCLWSRRRSRSRIRSSRKR